MLIKIIAVFIIFTFSVIIAFGIFSFIRLHKTGLFMLFMRGKWLLSLLTTTLMILFIVCSVAILMNKNRAVPVLFYTICIWLVYVWLYNLKSLFNLFVILRFDKGKTISHYMGRSKFFDELIGKAIELSNKGNYPDPETEDEPHAVRDASLEALLNDEEKFQELFPIAIRRKMKRKFVGLVVHTVVLVAILLLLK